ncbi:glycosyltransferase [Providencia huaxiensis]|uniref:glycosyltransferase n=1 Tax=Providencia huaxiensis TaxID=2027290 RepID=UPI0034E508C2
MVNYCFICVLYSKSPKESQTILSLSENNPIKNESTYFFWDNSAHGFKNELKSIFPNDNVSYFHNGKNTPLSKIYNTVIREINAGIYIILDDDSSFDEEYFLSLINFKHSDYQVCCPKIYHNNILISPGYIKGVRGYTLHEKELSHASENLCIASMMSGTAIKKDIFEKIKFDERLNFYGIDTKFYIDCNAINIKILILDYQLIHDSALRKTDDINQHIDRLKKLFFSKRIVFENKKLHKIRIAIYLLLLTINQCIKRKNIKYLTLLPYIFK